MHSLATRVHVNTPSRWAEAHKGANSAHSTFLVQPGFRSEVDESAQHTNA
jgi:hypothetical protein